MGSVNTTATHKYAINGIEEDLIQKNSNTPLEQVEPYGVGLFGEIE